MDDHEHQHVPGSLAAQIAELSTEYHQDCSIPPDEPVTAANAARLANLLLDHSKGTPGAHQWDDSDFQGSGQPVDLQVRDRMYSHWLRSMPSWRDGLGEGWVGSRVLGKGGMGIAGLWKYQPDESMRARHEQKRRDVLDLQPGASLPRQVEAVVVKQARATQNHGLYNEGKMYSLLNDADSEHIPRFYKTVQRDVGSGVRGMRIDSNRREVHRMFLEYLPGGDMDGIIQQCIRQSSSGKVPKFLREDRCWSVFDCLVKACTVMDYRVEIPNRTHVPPIWQGYHLVHFDLKPLNVFIGNRDSGLHADMPVHKVGDYGLAEFAPAQKDQDRVYRKRVTGRGTPHTLAPEQTRNNSWRQHVDPAGRTITTPNHALPSGKRLIGQWTNVYQIGCCMYMLMCLSTRFPAGDRTYQSQLTSELRKGETIGYDIERGIFRPRVAQRFTRGPNRGQVIPPAGPAPERVQLPYSLALKSLVLRCLMQDYHHRPTLFELRAAIIKESAIIKAQLQDEDPLDDSWAELTTTPLVDNVATEVQSNLQEPSEFDADDWRRRSDGVGFAPLERLLALEESDRLRRLQVLEARQFLALDTIMGNASSQPPPSPPTQGIRRRRSDITDSSENERSLRIKRNRIGGLRPMAPMRVTNFYLTLMIIDHHHRKPPRPAKIDWGPCSLDMTIKELKEQLHLSTLPFPLDQARIARPDANFADESGWDLPAEMQMREAARPISDGLIMLQGILELHRDAAEGDMSPGAHNEFWGLSGSGGGGGGSGGGGPSGADSMDWA